MSDSALSTSLLAACVRDVATRIGDRLPAAFDMPAGAVVLDGDAAAHALPEEAVAVRWPLVGQDAALAVAVTSDAARMLAADGEDLVAAMTRHVEPLVAGLAPLFGGAAPQLDAGTEVEPTRALADGPGDGVSVALDDAGTHRVTVGLRMVVGDDLLAPADAPVDEGASAGPEVAAEAVADPADAPSAQQGTPLPDAAAAGAPQAGMPLGDPGRMGPVGAGQVLGLPQAGPVAAGIPVVGAQPVAGMGGMPVGQSVAQAPWAGQQAQAHPAQFASFDQLTALPGAAHSMAMLGEVEMGVTAELGRTRLTVRDVLGLNPGSIIELDRAAGSPVDVVVNGTLIARGEVVVIDEEFGIRITEILGMAEQPSPFPMQVAQ